MKLLTRTTICVIGLTVLGLTSTPAIGADDVVESEFSVGLNVSEGNSDASALSLGLKSDRTGGEVERLLRADFLYGEKEGDKSSESAKGVLQYNWLYDDRAYVHMRGTLAYDAVADVDYRATIGPPGIGYYLIKEEDVQVGLEFAFEYLWEKVGGEERDAPTFRVTQRAEKKLNDTSKIWDAIDYMPEADEFGNYLLNAEVGIDAALTANMSLRVVFRDKYDSEPADDKEHNDIAILSGLVIKL